MNQAGAAVPPLPPKKHKRPPSPPPAATVNGATVPSKTVTLVDVFHGDGGGEPKSHVVKIVINPRTNGTEGEVDKGGVVCDVSSCVRISLGGGDMVQKENLHVGGGGGGGGGADVQPGNYFYYGPFNYGVMSSGQVSPSDTLDSGTCSDLDGTPSTPMKKRNGGVSVTMIGQHKRAPSSSSGAEVDSDDNESSISCDSLNSGKLSPITPLPQNPGAATILPQTLLQDIRQRNAPKLSSPKIDEKPYADRKKEQLQRQLEEEEEKNDVVIDTDMFYKFHINENFEESVLPVRNVVENETFAGYRDLLGDDGASTIRSAKGTVRGVKNRVRAGIATFLQINNATIKNYKEKEAGKVVVYTTTMGILRDTYQACMKVKQILRTLLVKYEERDVFMSSEYQTEIQERMRCDQVLVPQVFLEGVHIGDAETIERLNETGELRRLLKPFRSKDVCTTCQVCGGFRLLPCQICKGSKKSVHRNHFTAEFVALKCMNCDEVGLVKCSSCS